MKALLISSSSTFTGKNLVSLGLSVHYKNAGLRVGYFKPYGPHPKEFNGKLLDEDACFFQRSLGLEESIDKICPVLLTEQQLVETFQNGKQNTRQIILESFESIKKDKDLVLIGGPGMMSSGSMFGYSIMEFTQEVGASVIMVEKFSDDMLTGDACLNASREVGAQLAGIIFNRISHRREKCLEKCIRPFFRRNNISLLGTIPVDPLLGSVPIGEIVERLKGKILCGEDKLNELVERVSIGAMTVDVALKHFRAVRNKAVLTGGDRSDIQLAALETSTKCLILTGGYYPNDRILAKASEKSVPVIVVHHDTAEAMDEIDDMMGHSSLHSDSKIQRAVEVVEKYVDIDEISKTLELKV